MNEGNVIFLGITYKSFISDDLHKQTAVVGTSIVLQCQLHVDDNLNVTWIKSSTPKVNVSDSDNLTGAHIISVSNNAYFLMKIIILLHKQVFRLYRNKN